MDDVHAPLSITDLKVKWLLHFALRTKNSRRIISAINPVTTDNFCREAIVLLQIDTFGCQQKEMGHKGGQR